MAHDRAFKKKTSCRAALIEKNQDQNDIIQKKWFLRSFLNLNQWFVSGQRKRIGEEYEMGYHSSSGFIFNKLHQNNNK